MTETGPTMRRTSLLALALLAGVALTGCGSDASTSGAGPVSATAAAPATTVPDFPTGTAPADTVSFRPVLVAPTGSSPLGGGEELPTMDQLGPVAVDGDGIVRATATLNQAAGGVVNPLLAPGPAGIDAFNAIAAVCYATGAACPTGQIAFVLDGAVIMAPTVRAPSFAADQIQISGNWSLTQAEDVARRISAAAHG
jgi:hypothetical protein